MTILKELQERGLLKDITNIETIEKLLENNKAVAFAYNKRNILYKNKVDFIKYVIKMRELIC